MQRLIIGSIAAAEYLPNGRTPKDLDVFSPDSDHSDVRQLGQRVETFWHPLLERWIPPGTNRMATLAELYTIKVSHSYWVLKNGSWTKHMWDITRMRTAGAYVIQDFHDDLYKICEIIHGPKRVDLNKDKEEFFSPTVRRLYDHDSIHATVAHYDEPLYRRVLKDGSSVAVDMRKVRDLPLSLQLEMFREEIFATALERKVIPADYKFSQRAAYQWALQQMIVSYTRGWSAQFLVEHFDELRTYDVDYVELHLSRRHLLIPVGGNHAH